MNEVYAIWDSKASYYMPFFCERNDATAERAVQNALVDDKHPMARHAEDYSLFWIGTWDPEHGVIRNAAGIPRHVIDCWVIASRIEQETN